MLNKKEIFANLLYYKKRIDLNGKELKKIEPNAKFIYDKETDLEGFMVITNGELIVAFRGSEHMKDWITNFKSYHDEVTFFDVSKKVKVHGGVLSAYLKVRKEIFDFIKINMDKSIHNINVMGYSLGGGVAQICSLDLNYNFPFEVRLVTWGSMRVGNRHFSKIHINEIKNSFRVEIRRDPVPHLPPKLIGFFFNGGYSHVAKKENTWKLGPIFASSGIIKLIQSKFKKSPISTIFNHSLDLYESYCRKDS